MRAIFLIAAIAAMVCMATVSFAADSTFQKWSFSTDANSAAPELVNNVYGAPTATIYVDETLGTGWWDSMTDLYGNEQGWWDIATGSIVLNVPEADAGVRDIEVRVTYWIDMSGAPVVQLSPSASLVGTTTALVEEGPMGGGWYRDVWNLQMSPGSNPEVITILGDEMWGSQISEISVATSVAAVPEPGSLMALFSGMIGTVGYALRRKKA